mmetsp:Transcript_31537/g.92474  ORF Transcript_31537/g.92474 Transcript_31537/m.92474 type:complete len:207 (+) Transcript_31537:1581-2201(+)
MGFMALSVALLTSIHTSARIEDTSTGSFRSTPLPNTLSLPTVVSSRCSPLRLSLLICIMLETRSSKRLAHDLTILSWSLRRLSFSYCVKDSVRPMMPCRGLFSSCDTTAMSWSFFSSMALMRVTSVVSCPMPTMPTMLPSASRRAEADMTNEIRFSTSSSASVGEILKSHWKRFDPAVPSFLAAKIAVTSSLHSELRRSDMRMLTT